MTISVDQNASRRLRQYELAERLGQIGHWYWRISQETMVWSPQLYRIYQVEPDTFEVTISNSLKAFTRRDRRGIQTTLDAAIRSGDDFAFEAVIEIPDADVRTIRSMGECECDPTGTVIGLFGVVQDITGWREAEHALAGARQRHVDFAETSSDWLWETGPDHRFTYISPQIEHEINTPPSSFIGRTRRETIRAENLSLEIEMHLAWVEQQKPFRDFRYWRKAPDGTPSYVSISGKPFYDTTGKFLGFRGSGRNITEEEEARQALLRANRMMKVANKERSDAMGSLKEANALLEDQAEQMLRQQREIEHRAMHDPLTGIGNRRFLDDRLTEAANACRLNGAWLSALHIDLDRFKQINDTIGHAAGDALLVHVARTLKNTVGPNEFVARIGGDEFVVVSAGAGDQKLLAGLAQRIIDRMSMPFEFEGRECWFGASVGIATMAGVNIEPKELLVNADIALYRAKSHGRGRYEFFSSQLQAEIIRAKEIADGIRTGLKRGEFIPHFQPQIDASTFEITGFEALARWNHPRQGVQTPDVFLGIAEEHCAVADIDRQILERSLEHYHHWAGMGLSVPRVSVNVSAKRLLEPDLIDGLQSMEIPPGVIAFELLESVFLDDAEEQIIWNIDMLREMGIELEMDDFGSGHSSIISLIKLGPDAIKIDRELIAPITTDNARRELVRSIVEIGKSLDVLVFAEGVETMEHAHMLRDMGCDRLQGYVISKPLPAEAVPEFIREWNDPMSQLAIDGSTGGT